MDAKLAERKRFDPKGVVRDIPPDEVGDDRYTSTRNMVFIDERAERIAGVARVFEPPLFQPKFLVQTEKGGVLFWIYASDANVAVFDGVTHTDLTPAGGIIAAIVDGEWTGGKLNGLPFINNSADEPYFWDESLGSNFEPLPDWPAGVTCNAMRSFKYHLFALGITDATGPLQDHYMWSDAADEGEIPQSWTPLPTTEAGDDNLSETRGPIIDALVLRNSLIIYKDTSTYQVDYVAGNSVFANRLLFAEVGILAHNCVAEVSGVHYVFTSGDLIVHDGHNARSIANETVRSVIFGQMDPQTYVTSFVTWDPINRSVWFCFPVVGSRFPNFAVVYQIDTQVFGLRVLHNSSPYVESGLINIAADEEKETWDEDTAAWETDGTLWNETTFSGAIERLLQCDYLNSHLFAVDIGNTNDGELVDAQLNKDSMSLGDIGIIKTVFRVWPRVVGFGEFIQIRLGSQFSVSDDIKWGPYKDFRLGDEKLDYIMTGRFISIEFSGTTEQQWGIQSFELEFNQGGAF